MPIRRPCKAVYILVALLPLSVQGASYWTNSSGGTFSQAANWRGGVPGSADSAFFTNAGTYQVNWTDSAETAEAHFRASSGTVSLNIGAGRRWLLNTALGIGGSAGANAALRVTSGSLVATNSSGTVTANLGAAGTGALQLYDGNLNADRLVMTNVTGTGYGTSTLTLTRNCTLTTRGAELRVAANGTAWTKRLKVGEDGTGYAVWQVLGETNRVTVYDQGNCLAIGDRSSYNQVLVSGIGTLLLVSNATQPTTGGGIAVGGHTGYGYHSLVVTNGARVLSYGPNTLSGHDSRLVVTGTNSLFRNAAGYLYIYGYNNQLRVENGGKLWLSTLSLHEGGISNNTVMVTGKGSLFTNTSVLYLSAKQSRFVVRDGGLAHLASYPWFGGSCQVLVSDTGSVFRTPSTMYASDKGLTVAVVVTNGGLLSSESGALANSAGSVCSARVTGSGSVWTNSGSFSVGYNAGTLGTLRVERGGRVYSASGLIGQGSSSTGIVTMAHSGSVWTNRGAVNVGYGTGSKATLRFMADRTGIGRLATGGTLTITPGARLEVDISAFNNHEGADLVLVTYAAKSGSFAEQDITVTGRRGGTIDQVTGNRITLHVNPPAGTVVQIH